MHDAHDVVVPDIEPAFVSLADDLGRASTGEGVRHLATHGLVRALDRAVVARLFLLDRGRLLERAVAGDPRVAAGRRAPRDHALDQRRGISTPLGRPAGYRLMDLPLTDDQGMLGVLEVAAPTEVVHRDVHGLEWLSWHATVALRRVEADRRLRSEAAHAASGSFSLGFRVAAAASRAASRDAAVAAVVDALAGELGAPVVAWRVDAERAVAVAGDTAGLTRRARAAVAARRVPRVGSRDEQVRAVARATQRLLGVPRVTPIDAGAVVLVVADDVPALDGAGGWLADLLAGLPDPLEGGNGRLALAGLTAREREVLSLLAAGLGTADIAARLAISPMTVKTHVQNILGKLGVRSRLEAAVVAMHAS